MAIKRVKLEVVQGRPNPSAGWSIGKKWDITKNKWVNSTYYYRFSGGNGPKSNGDVDFTGNRKQNFQIELIKAGDGWEIIGVTVWPALANFEITQVGGTGRYKIKEKTKTWTSDTEYFVLVSIADESDAIRCHPMMRNSRIKVNFVPTKKRPKSPRRKSAVKKLKT